MQFTTVRSKEKDYDIYLKSEKLVHSQQEHEKMFPSYLEVEIGIQLCCKWIPAIWGQKNLFQNSQEQGKRL